MACERPLGDRTVAGAWKRQTFSAAVESVKPDILLSILQDCLNCYPARRHFLLRAFVPEVRHLGATLFPGVVKV